MNVRKKLLSCMIALTAVIICFFVLPTEANAASVEDLTFTLNSNVESYSVTDCQTSASGELVIPATYNGKPVTSIARYAFKDCTSLTSITIPDSVTRIGDYAFYGCTSLTSITIPDSVTSIGEHAFCDCDSLTSVTIGSGVTSIGYNAFVRTYNLKYVYITDPSAWWKISFGNHNANPKFDRGELHILDADGKEVTALVLDNTVTAIPDHGFEDCTGLTSITIPDSVTSIGKYAFDGCDNLTSVVLPKGITQINYGAFQSCDNLEKVYHRGTQNDWNNILIHSDNKALLDATIIHNFAGNLCITHTYSAWTTANSSTHKRICSACPDEEVANHKWNSGAVTKPATCKEAGVKTFTCTDCGGTKTEGIAKLTTHTYDHACDTSCNICGATRRTTHKYKTKWSTDTTNHWHECSVCKDKKDFAAHTPGAEATETVPQTCTTCGYIIKPALNHTHSFATEWTTDDAGHWHTCSGCEEKDSYAAHTWENGSCSVCGAVNTNATQPTTTPTEVQEPTSAPTEQPDTNKTEEKGNNTIFILIGGIVLGGGAVVAVGFIILKKKGLISK